MHREVQTRITKRNHKLLDYDRHRGSLRKIEDDKRRSANDEVKRRRLEQAVEEAEREFALYNQPLKEQLPILLAQRDIVVGGAMIQLQSFMARAQSASQKAIEGLEVDKPRIRRAEQEMAMAKAEIDQLDIVGPFTAAAQRRPSKRDSLATSPRSDISHQEIAPSPPSPVRGAKTVVQRNVTSDEESELSSVKQVKGKMGGAVAALTAKLKDAGIPLAMPARSKPSSTTPKRDDYCVHEDHDSKTLADRIDALAISQHRTLKTPTPPTAPRKMYVRALFDFTGQELGDLSFQAGDRIEVLKRTDTVDDWWTGRMGGKTGTFPANHVRED